MTVRWRRIGLIYCPNGERGWDNNSVLTPTPFALDENTIRIYGGLRDEDGRSRISYIDVDAADPSKILKVADKPVMNLGYEGTFDDNGMILGDVVRHKDEIRMYYVGFQIPQKAKFMAFTGLAISRDGGDTFERHSEAPVMDRSDEGLFIRAIHGVLHENDIWRVWYSAGSAWEALGGDPFPRYEIRCTESKDGIHFKPQGTVCLPPAADEYRIGRSRVRKRADGQYEMYFVYSTKDKHFGTGYALSPDGVAWTRCDDRVDMGPASGDWDSDMCGYAVPFEAKGKSYLFYSGNGMGKTGVGYAELISDAD